MDGTSGRLGKDRRVNLIVAWGHGFLLGIVVQCPCLLRHPGTKMSVQVCSAHHIHPGTRAFGESVVLENVHDRAWSLLRCYLLRNH